MPARVVFWWDMLLVGTLVNLVFVFVSLAMAAQHVDMGLVVAVHFVPLPYNLFLLVALLRSPGRTTAQASVGALWFAAFTLL